MDATSEKTSNYSVKCATSSHIFGRSFSSHELLRKAKETESSIVGLQERLRRYDRDFQLFSLLRQLYAT